MWATSTVTLIIIFSFAWLSIVPAIAFWWWLNIGATPAQNWRDLLALALNCWLAQPLQGGPVCQRLWWSETVAFGVMPIAAALNGTLYMWLMVLMKWALVGRITPKMMEKGETLVCGFV
jgi:hypothetical protein